jgi:hypothetical protein
MSYIGFDLGDEGRRICRRWKRIVAAAIWNGYSGRWPTFDLFRTAVPGHAEAAYDLRLAVEQRIALQALGKIGNGPIVNFVRLNAVRLSIGEKARQARPLMSVADPLKQSEPLRHQSAAASTAHDFGA